MSLLCAVAGHVWRFGVGPAVSVLVVVLAAIGCEDHAEPGPGSDPPEPAGLPTEERAAAKHTDEAFSVELTGPSLISVGERASFVVTLRPGTGYKVNAEYPHKFKPKEQEGLAFAQKVVGREQASIAKDVATLPVEVVAKAPGPRKVAGQLSFSVCTAEKCLIERRELQFDTVAK